MATVDVKGLILTVGLCSEDPSIHSCLCCAVNYIFY